MQEVDLLNLHTKEDYRLQYSEDFCPLHRPLINSKKLAALSPQAEVFYYRLLMVVDHWGNIPADPATLLHLMYLARAKPEPHQIETFIGDLIQAGLAEIYLSDAKNVDGEYMKLVHLMPHWTCGARGRPIRPKYPPHPKQPNFTEYRDNRRKRQLEHKTSPQPHGNRDIEQEQEQEHRTGTEETPPYGCLDCEDARDTPPSEHLLNCLACRRFAASPQMHEWAQLNVARTLACVAGSWPVATRERTRRILAHYDLLPHGKVDLDHIPDPPQDPRLFEEIPKAELLGDLEGLDL